MNSFSRRTYLKHVITVTTKVMNSRTEKTTVTAKKAGDWKHDFSTILVDELVSSKSRKKVFISLNSVRLKRHITLLTDHLGALLRQLFG